MTTGVDGDDVLEAIFGLFDDTMGDEPVLKTTLVERGRHDTRYVQAFWGAVYLAQQATVPVVSGDCTDVCLFVCFFSSHLLYLPWRFSLPPVTGDHSK